VSRPAAPTEAPVDSGVPRDESTPPINLDDILRDEPPTTPTAPEVTPETDEIPPPFDSKGSGGAAPRDRTLNALTSGLNTAKPAAKAVAPADPWRAAPVRRTTGEKTATEGPVLNEPNLMSAPDDTAPLQATPDSSFDTSDWSPVTPSNESSEQVTMVANWDEASASAKDTQGGNPLRASNGSDSRRTNPLRRR
jgi:hypothetical protein